MTDARSQDRGVRLMLALQAGDDSAFDAIVAEYQGAVFSLLRRLLGPGPALEDLAQEVFLRLYRGRVRYRPQGKLSTFLYRITYNLALNRLRDRRRRREVALPSRAGGEPLSVPGDRAEAPYNQADRRTWSKLIGTALQGIPENQRTALVLQHYDGLDLGEIAEVLGISPKAVKSLLHRARENLREILGPYRSAEHDV